MLQIFPIGKVLTKQQSRKLTGIFKILILVIPLSFMTLDCTPKLEENAHMISISNVVDLTHTLTPEFPYIPVPGITFPFSMNPIATIEKNYVAANEWRIHEHLGTQIDAPNHFIADGISLEQLPIESLIVPAAVIDISEKAMADPNTELTVEDILAWEEKYGRLPENVCVFMNSGWEKRIGDPSFIGLDSTGVKHFPGISLEAAKFLINERDISAVGVDVLSFDPGWDDEYRTHKMILGAGKWAVEAVANLGEIPASGATVFIGATKVGGATGGPVRLIAVW